MSIGAYVHPNSKCYLWSKEHLKSMIVLLSISNQLSKVLSICQIMISHIRLLDLSIFFCKSITRSDVRDQITIGMLLVSPHHPFRQVPLCSYNKYLPPW
jgi:hypothetical protein